MFGRGREKRNEGGEERERVGAGQGRVKRGKRLGAGRGKDGGGDRWAGERGGRRS